MKHKRLALEALAILHQRADDTGTVTLSRTELAAALGVSGVSARNAVRSLEQICAVTVSRVVAPDGRPMTNIYRLHADVEG
jgi:predicted ArsR family transcriptional regulator